MPKPLAEIIRRWPTREAEQWVQAFVREACSNPRILAVVAFGSAVRSADYCADVDLLVIYARLKAKVLERPVEVDIRWHERSEAERLIAEGHELLGWVVRFGELICERNGYWSELRKAWLGRIPFPSAAGAFPKSADFRQSITCFATRSCEGSGFGRAGGFNRIGKGKSAIGNGA